MKDRRVYSLQFTVYSLVLIAALSCGCAKRQEEKSAEKEEAVEQKVSTFNLAGYGEKAKKKWEIEGKTADIFENIVKLDAIVARAYGEDRQVTVTADKGSVDKSVGNIHLEQNVVAKTSDGATLTADYLDWQAKEERVTTAAKVVVEKENMVTQGKGAVAQPELKKVKLEEDVIVKINPASQGEGEPAVITCAGPLEVDYANNVAVFNDDVKVEDSRGKLAADKMTVYFDQKAQKISRVVAKGNVKISRGDNTSMSDEATYLANENKITLSGSPKLVIYPEKGEPAAPLGVMPGTK